MEKKDHLLRLSRDPSDWIYYPGDGQRYRWSAKSGWWRIVGSTNSVTSGYSSGTDLLLTRPDWPSIVSVNKNSCRPATTAEQFRDLEKTIVYLERYINGGLSHG